MHLQTEYLKVTVTLKEGYSHKQLQAFRIMEEDPMAQKMIMSMIGSMAQGYMLKQYEQESRRNAKEGEDDEIAQCQPLAFQQCQMAVETGASKNDCANSSKVQLKVFQSAKICRVTTGSQIMDITRSNEQNSITNMNVQKNVENTIEVTKESGTKTDLKRQFDYFQLFTLKFLANNFEKAEEKRIIKKIFKTQFSHKRLEYFLEVIEHRDNPYRPFASRLCNKIAEIAADSLMWKNFFTRTHMHQKTQDKISKIMSQFSSVIRKAKL